MKGFCCNILLLTLISSGFPLKNKKTERSKPLCQLAAFLEGGTIPLRIDSGVISQDGDFLDCSQSEKEKCKNMVLNQAQQGTGNGNLTLIANDDEGYTIGDILCDKADSVEENVQNKEVRIYWRLCGESWQRTHFRMSQHLCCIDGLYVPCDKIKNYG